MTPTPVVLVLAGLDPSGGAGLFADVEAIRAAGARPLGVPTALTAQTLRRMHGFQPLSPQLAMQTARALLEEEPVRAIKVGMVGTPAMARAIAGLLAEARLPAVVDPVLAASSGGALFQGGPEAAREAYAELFAGAIATPNALEAQVLLGLAEPPRSADALESAARDLVQRGARAALVKGGHAEGPESIDVLCEKDLCIHFAAHRLDKVARGTGCRLASALAARLALGRGLEESARAAKALVLEHLASAGSPREEQGVEAEGPPRRT
ncbi:MAG: hydroxymethylpyrimidine/phosphomethylpyrimidine kinase [Deltaproteobacteria bacterium]|nr:MAG: hydroxymethylpyrimidine/phosphomethylpyrimidine kinase [Deltaproteobacteria bacterium]TMB34920.1 MAG: hydroxymethylpyrimidine/phosphomethylpyrimidine kinase [Deltaproteobacteria bacterium]